MRSRLPRWLLLTLIVLGVVIVVSGLVTGSVLLIRSPVPWQSLVGWAILGLLAVTIAVIVWSALPPLIKLYRFQRYFKKHEAELSSLPGLVQGGRMQEALVRFESVMKRAPENAYFFYMRAYFLQAAGKLPDALSAANRALTMVDRDQLLPLILQQLGGQMGQPTTVAGFKEQLETLRRSLEPRVSQIRERREKAVSRRKKKSR